MARPHHIVPGPGRPRRPGRQTQINIRLSVDELAELKRLAAQEHLSVSEFVRVFKLAKKGTMQQLDDQEQAAREQRELEKRGQLRIEGT